MGFPHFLALPFPIQGIVNPLMQFSQVLAKHGSKITFVQTEFNHKRVSNHSGAGNDILQGSNIKIFTLPDGLDPEDNRSDVTKLLSSIKSTMPARLQKLIEDVNALEDVDNKISCIVVTFNMGWALEVGQKLGIKGASLFPASATSMACAVCIPKLIEDKIIDTEGHPTEKREIQLSPNMPMMNTTEFPWRGNSKFFFDHIVQEVQTIEIAGWWLCNTAYDLEPGSFFISPKLLPIGPLMESDSNKISFWQEDTTCLDWLDQHPPQSVIYVSFGSLAVMEPSQFKELALGLDLLNKPFLWVVRKDNGTDEINAYPDEFRGSQGKIVGWAPQKKILNHPAIACFISHCGWNSTLEGVHAGVPFLCLPFFSDQFLDKSYICDVWKIGVELDKDENGLVSRGEIKKKVEQVLGDEDMKSRSLKLKEMTINSTTEGGQSSKNLDKFINWAKY